MTVLKKFHALVVLLLPVPVTAGTVTYIYTDPQGTPLAETDANGTVTATFDYRPYGVQTVGGPPNGPGYTGHLADADTGLTYMQARYYDPELARFLSVDPVPVASGSLFNINRMAYANNNPTSNSDPTGMDTNSDGRTPNDPCNNPGAICAEDTAQAPSRSAPVSSAGANVPRGTPRGMEKYFSGSSDADRLAAALAVMNYYKIDYHELQVFYRSSLVNNADTIQTSPYDAQVYVGPALFRHSFGLMGAILAHEVEGHWALQYRVASKILGRDLQAFSMREVQAYDYELSPANVRRFNLSPTEIREEGAKRDAYYRTLTHGNQSMVNQGIYKPLGD